MKLNSSIHVSNVYRVRISHFQVKENLFKWKTNPKLLLYVVNIWLKGSVDGITPAPPRQRIEL